MVHVEMNVGEEEQKVLVELALKGDVLKKRNKLVRILLALLAMIYMLLG